MVRALERRAAAFAVRDEVRAVAADVLEASELTVTPAHGDDGDVPGTARDVSARLVERVGAADVLPGAREDPLALESCDRGVRVPGRGKRPAGRQRVR